MTTQEAETTKPKTTGDAFEDVLYGSESESDDSDDEQIEARRRTSSSSDSDATLARPDAVSYVDDDAFGAWEAAPAGKAQD